ncbi:hypothetical protein B2A_12572, partial [mine drainage metagenome]
QTNPDVQTLQIGNPALQAERSNNIWFSAKWSPRAAPGLSIDLTYYRLEINNAIGRPSAQQALLDCYELGDALACSGIDRATDGQLTLVSTQAFNDQSITTDWVTGGMRYAWSTAFGQFALRGDLAWTPEYRLTTTSANGVSVEDLA